MTSSQLFIVALLSQAVIVIGMVLTFRATTHTAKKVEAVEVKVDGRLSELLELTKRSATAAGNLEGRAERQAEDDARGETP